MLEVRLQEVLDAGDRKMLTSLLGGRSWRQCLSLAANKVLYM